MNKKITPIGYFEFFHAAKSAKYESTKQVVDSFFQYSRLLNYRLSVSRSNDDYWNIVNELDNTMKQYKLLKTVIADGRSVNAWYLATILLDFKTRLDILYRDYGYSSQWKCGHKPIIARDSFSLITIWLNALTNIRNNEQIVENNEGKSE
jgi:hypothetical protein